jgi:hypothetical protein
VKKEVKLEKDAERRGEEVSGETFYHIVKSLDGYTFTKVEDQNNSKYPFLRGKSVMSNRI